MKNYQPDPPLILVVDDEKMMRMLLRRSLETEGYRVIEAKDGLEAIATYQNFYPDLILLDTLMPVMDGLTCCQQLQTIPRGDSLRDPFGNRTPILMVTALDNAESVDRAFEVGATDYITKPIHWAVLRQRVRRLLEAKQTMEELRQQMERERLMGMIQERIRQSLNLEEILNTTVTEVRQFLQTDRVLILRFEPDWTGIVVVESVADGWISALASEIYDPCFSGNYIEPYQKGRIKAIEDIYQADLNQCHIDFLAQFQVRANLVVPILQEEHLWGLLVAHHCCAPRRWQQSDVELLERLATQVAIAIQQANLYEQLQAANRELRRLASLDGLTQVANRRCFDETLEREWRRTTREKQPISLILFDIDYFKYYNDTYGHLAGDSCLQQIVTAVTNVLKRPADLLARYGGEEFAVILPNTDLVGAIYIAEQIQKVVKSLAIPHSSSAISQYVTLSIGIARTIPLPNTSPTTLITMADQELYQAKTDGRDCIRYIQEPVTTSVIQP